MKKNIIIILLSFLSSFCSQTEQPSVTDVLMYTTDIVPDTTRYQPVPPLESFANTQLRAELFEVYISDQSIRNKYLDLEKKYGHDSKEVQSLKGEWRKIDSVNSVKVTRILDRYGWIGPYEIGDQGNTALFLVIQHSDLKIQDKYLPMMRRAVKENRAKASELALLEDRVLIGHGKKQLFGSQLEMDTVTRKYKLSPIEDESNVNKRRAAVGLQSLEEYAKIWDIDYVLPKR